MHGIQTMYQTRRCCLSALTVALVAGLLTPAMFAGPSDKATQAFQTTAFRLSLQKTSQTLVSLAPKDVSGFDFAPSNRFAQRLGDGNYRLGDIDLRLRSVGSRRWQDYASAYRRGSVKALPTSMGDLAAADITNSMGRDFPLRITRRWSQISGDLVLRFTLANPGNKAIEVGGLGLPMVFDNILTDRTLEQAHEHAVFYDPNIGEDGGYLQVTRLNGAGPALLVVPEKGTPFELYKPILDGRDASGKMKIFNDPEKRGITFEGFYDWMVASKGFAASEWKGVQQWNPPTSFILAPGQSRSFGLRFVLSSGIRQIEPTLIRNGRPVVIGIPGYVLPTDTKAELFVHAPQAVTKVESFPRGAIAIGPARQIKGGWIAYALAGKACGRVRLVLSYADGAKQSVQYLITKPEAEVVSDMGRFLTTKQWYVNPHDRFRRSPSIMGYDRDARHIVTQDGRVWIAGLSDEGGAGSWLAAVMKELNNPVPAEVAKIEAFADDTLWGGLQVSNGPDKYGVRKSLFYYDPVHMPPGTYDKRINWKTWAAWDREKAFSVGRSFNYPHVAVVWWVLYRLARYHNDLVRRENWQTYLSRAANTVKAMVRLAPDYVPFGQMEGDTFIAIIGDLQREGMTADADEIEAVMKARADRWKTLKYPFGSEMPWDSTGQEEVYAWMRHFGDEKQAAETREVILGYDPAIPSWAYNGSARRYWDFLYAGKLERVERQLHHYGSSINAIPLFDSYRRNPTDFFLLRVAYGGLMGSLSNISADGFASAAFHSFPDVMAFDAYSGDYGVSFFGHAFASAAYLVNHPVFGWLGFGGNVGEDGKAITLTPTDSARRRVFIAPAGLWLSLRAGKFRAVRYNPTTGVVEIVLAPKERYTPDAWLGISMTTPQSLSYRAEAKKTRGLYVIPLVAGPTTARLLPAVAPPR